MGEGGGVSVGMASSGAEDGPGRGGGGESIVLWILPRVGGVPQPPRGGLFVSFWGSISSSWGSISFSWDGGLGGKAFMLWGMLGGAESNPGACPLPGGFAGIGGCIIGGLALWRFLISAGKMV